MVVLAAQLVDMCYGAQLVYMCYGAQLDFLVYMCHGAQLVDFLVYMVSFSCAGIDRVAHYRRNVDSFPFRRKWGTHMSIN